MEKVCDGAVDCMFEYDEFDCFRRIMRRLETTMITLSRYMVGIKALA